jgi:hypothetical protein
MKGAFQFVKVVDGIKLTVVELIAFLKSFGFGLILYLLHRFINIIVSLFDGDKGQKLSSLTLNISLFFEQ